MEELSEDFFADLVVRPVKKRNWFVRQFCAVYFEVRWFFHRKKCPGCKLHFAQLGLSGLCYCCSWRVENDSPEESQLL